MIVFSEKPCRVCGSFERYDSAQNKCVPCHRKRNKQRYADNPERFKANVNKYREGNKEKIREKKKSPRVREQTRKSQRAWHERNRERVRSQQREWCASKPGVQAGSTPSLDRIDSSLGYVKGNVWVISWRANHIKTDASLEELKQLVAGLERLQRARLLSKFRRAV